MKLKIGDQIEFIESKNTAEITDITGDNKDNRRYLFKYLLIYDFARINVTLSFGELNLDEIRKIIDAAQIYREVLNDP